MQSRTRAADKRRHLSRHERQRQARADAFSRRTRTTPLLRLPVKLATEELELIDQLVRRDRTAVSSALLAIAGIGADDVKRLSVLVRVSDAARSARNQGAISERRCAQIARHVMRAIHRNGLDALPEAEHAVRGSGGGR
jgi:hypothetical protein